MLKCGPNSQVHGCLCPNLSTQAPESGDPQGKDMKLRGHLVHGTTQGRARDNRPGAPTGGSERPGAAEAALDLGWARTAGDWGRMAGTGGWSE